MAKSNQISKWEFLCFFFRNAEIQLLSFSTFSIHNKAVLLYFIYSSCHKRKPYCLIAVLENNMRMEHKWKLKQSLSNRNYVFLKSVLVWTLVISGLLFDTNASTKIAKTWNSNIQDKYWGYCTKCIVIAEKNQYVLSSGGLNTMVIIAKKCTTNCHLSFNITMLDDQLSVIRKIWTVKLS